MSGVLSVPFAFLAVYLPESSRTLWFILAYAALAFTAASYWKKTRTKLRLKFDKLDEFCYRPDVDLSSLNSQGQVLLVTKCDYYRIKIECDSIGVVSRVTGRLIDVKKLVDGKWVLALGGEPLTLTMAPAIPGSPSKDVFDQVPEPLDGIVLTEKPYPIQRNTKVAIPTENFSLSSSLDPGKSFSLPGIYLFHFVVSSPDCKSASIDLKLDWTGDWKTSTVSENKSDKSSF